HIRELRRQDDFPGLELLALLLDCQILFKVDAAGGSGLRPAAGHHNLVLLDFHDLLFHTRSTEGPHANPLGGEYPHAVALAPLPAVRPRWTGKKSICASSRRRIRRQSPRSRSSCGKVIRPVALITSNRSRSPNFRNSSAAPRAPYRYRT